MRLHARESIGSWFEQSLVARRQEHHSFRAETELAFDPRNFQQAAGLVHYYNRYKFHFAAVTWHETAGRSLTLMSCNGDWPDGRLTFPLSEPVPLGGASRVKLAAQVDGPDLQFHFDVGAGWQTLGPVLDASVISDEGGRGEHASFTGAFIGMAAFDTSGSAIASRLFLLQLRSAPAMKSSLEIHELASGQNFVVHQTVDHIEAPNWSRDGKHLLFNGEGRLWRIPVAGRRTAGNRHRFCDRPEQ